MAIPLLNKYKKRPEKLSPRSLRSISYHPLVADFESQSLSSSHHMAVSN